MKPEPPSYKCPTCQKQFNRPSALQTHSYTHTGEKPFECAHPGCGRRFSVISNLRRHRRVHTKTAQVPRTRLTAEQRHMFVQRLIQRSQDTNPPQDQYLPSFTDGSAIPSPPGSSYYYRPHPLSIHTLINNA
ncbi:hypothetical protein DM01DRAFT_1283722 [Hesseltinella vesiculosa]|uniref:C2H2-type domain-containing protein n=1 Tax=Hesseltinella vesiculosa TaxID=101127 RepID=A0A1X2GPF7_9FUNG|nr:hypothetical protein DM01DRAFT_1283722 [Hesseltinella vesiculosa]